MKRSFFSQSNESTSPQHYTPDDPRSMQINAAQPHQHGKMNVKKEKRGREGSASQSNPRKQVYKRNTPHETARRERGDL